MNSKPDKAIVIIGTLDTKEPEVDYLCSEIEIRGHRALVIAPGVLRIPQIRADITREEVAGAGGRKLSDLVKNAELGVYRGNITQVMMQGLASIAKDLYSSGKMEGIISLGGSTGTALAGASMKVLPTGIPKIAVSTSIYV